MRRFTWEPKALVALAGGRLLAACGMSGPTQDLAASVRQPSG
jgi:hypothetical protein